MTEQRSPGTSRSVAVRIALLLCLVAIVLGMLRFGRLDWSGIPFERGPLTQERVVSDDCTEYIRPYTTDTGRVVKPINVDEQQYMSMVDYFRGTPKDELHVTCMLAPFVTRPATPWLAHFLPFDEGISLGLVNMAMMLVATFSVVFALRAQGFSARVVAAASTLFVVGWNTFFFSSVVLLDAGVVGLVALCWYLVCSRRPWLVWPVMLIAYPFKETVGFVVLPVLAAWAWGEFRSRRRGAMGSLVPTVVAVAAFGVSAVVTRELLLQSDATWDLAPSIGPFINNLFSPIGLASFAVATVPLFVPALATVRDRVRSDGWFLTVADPAVLGVVITAALCFWVTLSADLSPRFAWVGFPFAASLAAFWFTRGRPARWLERLRLPAWLD